MRWVVSDNGVGDGERRRINGEHGIADLAGEFAAQTIDADIEIAGGEVHELTFLAILARHTELPPH